MNNARFDPETLAAFLDGKLAGAERERVLQLIAESDEWYEVMVDAVAVSAEVPQSEPRRLEGRKAWGRRSLAGGVLIAAGLGAVLVFARRPTTIDAVDGASQLVIDERLRASVAADWGATRGSSEPLSLRARAFRMGAQFADLELAFRARDSIGARTLSTSIASLTVELAGGRPAAERVQYLARDGRLRASTKERRAAASEVRSLVDERWFDLGAWSETARRAAHAGQLQFLSPGRPAVQRLDSLLVALDRLPAVERAGTDAAVARLRVVRDRGESPGGTPESVAAALDSTVSELGRR